MRQRDGRRIRRLLRGFDSAATRLQAVLKARYGEEEACTLVAPARAEYRRLLPDLPDLNGRQPFTPFIVTTALALAFYRALAENERPEKEAGELAYALTVDYLWRLPPVAAQLIESLWFSRLFWWRLRRRAEQSKERAHTGDFVYRCVEGSEGDFDFGVDYFECAVVAFLRSQGAPELAPYICALDQLSSDAFGWGLVRTTTLAEGGSRCDFRFKRGEETRITSTVLPVLQQ